MQGATGFERLEMGFATEEEAVVSERVCAVQLVGLHWPTRAALGSATVIAAARLRG